MGSTSDNAVECTLNGLFRLIWNDLTDLGTDGEFLLVKADLIDEEQTVLQAVDELRRESADAVKMPAVAKRSGYDQTKTKDILSRLVKRKLLVSNRTHGYRLTPSVQSSF